MNYSRREYMKKKKRKRLKRRLLIMFILLVIPIGGTFAFLAYQTLQAAGDTYNELLRGSKSELRNQEVKILEDPFSILLVGLEDYSTNHKGGRTDTLIIATFNPHSETMKLLSIPRDTYTYIYGKGKYDKINHAYGVGGIDETIKAVEGLMEIPIDYYILVSFEGFKNIIDELGGVEVQVPFDFYEYTDTAPARKLYFYKGPATLNGEEALAYARMRKQDPQGDFGRNERQKEIIISLINKASSPKNFTKLDNLLGHIGNNVETNLKLSDAIDFYKRYRGFTFKNIENLKIEGNDQYINDIYYFSPNQKHLENVKQTLQEHLEIEK